MCGKKLEEKFGCQGVCDEEEVAMEMVEANAGP